MTYTTRGLIGAVATDVSPFRTSRHSVAIWRQRSRKFIVVADPPSDFTMELVSNEANCERYGRALLQYRRDPKIAPRRCRSLYGNELRYDRRGPPRCVPHLSRM